MIQLPDPSNPEETLQFVPRLSGEQTLMVAEKSNICAQANGDPMLWPKELYMSLSAIASVGYDRSDATQILQNHGLISQMHDVPAMVWAFILRSPVVAAARLTTAKETLSTTYLSPMRRIRLMDDQLCTIRDVLEELRAKLDETGLDGEERMSCRAQIGHFQTMMLQYLRQIALEQDYLENWIGIKGNILVGSDFIAGSVHENVAFAPVASQGADTDVGVHQRVLASKSLLLEGLRGLKNRPKDEILAKLAQFKAVVGDTSIVKAKVGGKRGPSKRVPK